MGSNKYIRVGLPALMVMTAAVAQDRLDPATSIKFDLRNDAPIKVESFDSSESRVYSRVGTLVIDLHVVAKLRNTSRDNIRGVTLLLLAHESIAGGKMSTSVSGNVAPGDVFDMAINGRMMRPAQGAVGPLVRVTLDGVLFRNYEFYGPDRLNSRRQMIAREMEADRDRKYFKQVLQARGPDGLKQEMLESLSRQSARPHLDVQVAHGPSVASSALTPDRQENFAFLQLPDSPIKPMSGSAEIALNLVRTPQVEVQNTSVKNIRYVEIAWLVKDAQGNRYFAGSLPASDGELYLPPGRTARVLQDSSLRFSRSGGQPVEIRNLTGFVNQVEYSDQNVWIPKRETLKNSDLLKVIPPSSEELWLTDLYNHKGIEALVRELNR